MKGLFDKLVHYFSAEVNAAFATRIFSGLVYFWFLINAMMLWGTKEYLWGAEKIFYRHGNASDFISNFFYQLIYDSHRFNLIFGLHLFGSAVGILDTKWNFVPRLIAWITGFMLYYSAIQVFNSGMLLMLSMAFFASFIYTRAQHPLRIVISNSARIAAITQLCIVYIVATIYKLSGTQWLNGEALYYALQIDQFSSGFSKSIADQMWIFKILTYFGLLYQLLFPILIWIKKIRVYWLIPGLIFHLFIGAFMHLWDFALAMIFCYALFLPDLAKNPLKKGHTINEPS